MLVEPPPDDAPVPLGIGYRVLATKLEDKPDLQLRKLIEAVGLDYAEAVDATRRLLIEELGLVERRGNETWRDRWSSKQLRRTPLGDEWVAAAGEHLRRIREELPNADDETGAAILERAGSLVLAADEEGRSAVEDFAARPGAAAVLGTALDFYAHGVPFGAVALIGGIAGLLGKLFDI